MSAKLLAALCAVAGCAGAPLHASAPASQAEALTRAVEAEQRVGPAVATERYLALVDDGAADLAGLAEVSAALDALDTGPYVVGFERFSDTRGLVEQVPGARAEVASRLEHAYRAASPPARMLIARTLEVLAMRSGDASDAARWRRRTGALEKATIVGPLSAEPYVAFAHPTVVESRPALASRYPGVAPFFREVTPVVAEVSDLTLALEDAGAAHGLYVVAVDVELPRTQRVFIGLRSHAPASVEAGGLEVVKRTAASGEGGVVKFGWVDLPEGRSRVVVRAANRGHDGISLLLLDAAGEPVEARAPAPGEAASGRGSRAGPVAIGEASASPVVLAAGALGVGDVALARTLVEAVPDASRTPALLLTYARAQEASHDLPLTHRRAAARVAYGRVAAAWPDAWEPAIAAAMIDYARRGTDGGVDALSAVTRYRAAHAGVSPVVLAIEGALGAELGLEDVAALAIANLRAHGATSLDVELERRGRNRVGRDAATFACTAEARDLWSGACADALHGLRDQPAFVAEITRLRELTGSPRMRIGQQIDEAIAHGQLDEAMRLYEKVAPANRSLTWLAALADRPSLARGRLVADAVSAVDAPGALPQLMTLFGDGARVEELLRRGRSVVDAERATPSPAGAATVLLHDERFALEATGLLRFTIHDVRKVSGTQDVGRGAAHVGPSILGREAQRIVRRLVHKKDGRVLEPEHLAAVQSNVDVSQLEPGDMVEQVLVGYAAPTSRSSQLVVDGPDLMPERTAIVAASIELAWPASLELARWSHPLLGAAKVRREGDVDVARWELSGAAPRRAESSTARGERAVAITFGTFGWKSSAGLLADDLAHFDDVDPVVAQWARKVTAGATGRAAVERVVAASGTAIPHSTWSLDSPRVALDTGRGSRAVLVRQALLVLGIPADVLLAEPEPAASSATYPPHPSRFSKPIVLAHLPAADGGDAWIEADIGGPPLPPDHISPELRGRAAINAAGEQLVVGASGASRDDEDAVELALRLDERGDAAGTVTLSISGRDAQPLAQRLDKAAGFDRAQALRAAVLAWFPWAAVDDASLTSAEGAWPLVVRANVRFTGYAQREASTLVLPGFEPIHRIGANPTTLGQAYTALLGRTTALSIGRAIRYRLHRRIELTAGARLARAASDVRVTDAHVKATRAVSLEGNTLDERFTLAVTTGHVSSNDYQRFSDEVRRVDDGFQESVRVVAGAR